MNDLITAAYPNAKLFRRERKVKSRSEKEKTRGNASSIRFDLSDLLITDIENFANKIICGDSEKVLKKIPPNSVDIIVTSPPHNFGLNYEDDKENDAIYVPSHHLMSKQMLDLGFLWKGEIIGEKNNHNCRYTAWGSRKSPSMPYLKYSWEFVEIFSKQTHGKPGDQTKIDITGDEFKKWVYAKWYMAPERNMKDYGHPAMFPKEFVLRLLKLFSYRGDVVLDHFNGVGTTTLCATETDRKYIGVDISQKYTNRLAKNEGCYVRQVVLIMAPKAKKTTLGEIVKAYNLLVRYIDGDANLDSTRAYGGIVRSGKDALVESIAKNLVQIAWKNIGGDAKRLSFEKKPIVVPIRKQYIDSIKEKEVRDHIRKNIQKYKYRFPTDVHISIDGKLAVGIECKAYTENTMIKRIVVDFTFLKSAHKNAKAVLLQLESQLGGDYSNIAKKVKYGSPSTRTILSYFDVDLHILTLLEGERRVDKPIHKKAFYFIRT